MFWRKTAQSTAFLSRHCISHLNNEHYSADTNSQPSVVVQKLFIHTVASYWNHFMTLISWPCVGTYFILNICHTEFINMLELKKTLKWLRNFISNKCCSFELYIHQQILKIVSWFLQEYLAVLFSTLIITGSWFDAHYIKIMSSKSAY